MLDDSAMESVKVALDEVIETKQVSEAMSTRMQGILVYSASSFKWDTGNMSWWVRTITLITSSYIGVGFKWTEECVVAVQILRSRVDAAERVPCNPIALTRRDWRLVVKSDGSDVGVGA